jgi:hypothetical protein
LFRFDKCMAQPVVVVPRCRAGISDGAGTTSARGGTSRRSDDRGGDLHRDDDVAGLLGALRKFALFLILAGLLVVAVLARF